MPGPKPVLLVEVRMLCALGKSIETHVLCSPRLEYFHGFVQQAPGNSHVPVLWINSQRPEYPDAAPVERKVGADQLAVNFGGKRSRRVSPKASTDVVSVSHEFHRVWQAKKRAEREPHYSICLVHIALFHWPDQDAMILSEFAA